MQKERYEKWRQWEGKILLSRDLQWQQMSWYMWQQSGVWVQRQPEQGLCLLCDQPKKIATGKITKMGMRQWVTFLRNNTRRNVLLILQLFLRVICLPLHLLLLRARYPRLVLRLCHRHPPRHHNRVTRSYPPLPLHPQSIPGPRPISLPSRGNRRRPLHPPGPGILPKKTKIIMFIE